MTEKKRASDRSDAEVLSAEQLLTAALDGWERALEEAAALESTCSDLQRQNEQLLEKLVATQERLISLFEERRTLSQESVGSPLDDQLPHDKRRGRPRKLHRIDAQFLEWFEGERIAFSEANPGTRKSDAAVLTWSYKRQFLEWGLRPSRVDSKEFQGKLKSIRNQISDLRNPVRKLPEKG